MQLVDNSCFINDFRKSHRNEIKIYLRKCIMDKKYLNSQIE